MMFLLLLVSCKVASKELQIATGAEGGSYINVGNEIANIIQTESDINIITLSGNGFNSITNCQLLIDNKVDLVLAQNDISIKDIKILDSTKYPKQIIRTIMPLYDEICFIIYKAEIEPKSFNNLLYGRKVCIGEKGSGTEKFAYELFKAFGIATSKVKIINCESNENLISDSIDVSINLTGFNNTKISEMLLNRNGKIFSLDDYTLMNNGSSVEGICMNNVLWQPYLIPKATYKNQPEIPILTISVKSVLLGTENIDAKQVYEILETILNNKATLTSKLNILRNLEENLQISNLNFPIHSGTRMYLNRNKPTFLERYAESIGVVFTILISIFGGIKGIVTWNKLHKKNRIDKYYQILLDTHERIPNLTELNEYNLEIHKLLDLRKKAFEELINEKLIANESFNIFIDLLNDTLNDLKAKLE